MTLEQYTKIINNTKSTLNKDILEKISDFKYKEVDGYYVIEAYVKSNIKAKEIGEVLRNVQEHAEECGYSVLVDFLKG